MQLTLTADWERVNPLDPSDGTALRIGNYLAGTRPCDQPGMTDAVVFAVIRYEKGEPNQPYAGGIIAEQHGFTTVAQAQQWCETIISADNLAL